MRQIWQLNSWPNVKYDENELLEFERLFLQKSGLQAGSAAHLENDDQLAMTIVLMANEALKTSEIEDEHFNCKSLRSSIRHHLGLGKNRRKTSSREEGIAEMIVNLYQAYDTPLSHDLLYE